MKTYYAHLKSLRAWSVFGLVAAMTASCGSYQNTSYYDKDGVYGSAGSDVRKKETASTTANNQGYKDYFDSKQESSEVFTDVDNYTSATDSTDTTYRYASDNAGWGSSSENVVVNVYDNSWGWNYWNTPAWGWYGSGWNWNIGWGWNSWYGPGWGWNSWYGPGWGYYGGWGWGGYYGHHHHGNYAYSLGRRGSGYNYGVNSGRRNNSYAAVGGRSGSRNYGRSAVNNGGRRSVTSYSTRNSGTRNTNYSTSNSSSTRNNSNYTPSRSSSSSSGSSRSYNSGSSGGSRSSGGSYGGSSGGGGRSGGGGGGRRG